jgi:2',3'-cyclic-nucleotide 2'-phosphodiesterase/3'-nucleotidase
MATSDLHMHIAAHDYHADVPCVLGGLCQTATLIAQARAEVPGAVLLDNGDFLQGSPLGDYVARTRPQPHPMIAAMNHLRYDAVNLGNHDFSYGLETLATALRDAEFVTLSANTVPTADAPVLPLPQPWTIIERRLPGTSGDDHLIRIGLIGVLPPETEVWERAALNGQVRMQPMAETVARHVPQIRAAGADVVVVLAHCGPGQVGQPRPAAAQDPPDGALSIAAIPGVDAVVMGHVHLVFPNAGTSAGLTGPGLDPVAGTLHGKPAVMPGFFGSHLGIIDLTLDQTASGWVVRGHHSAIRPIATRTATGRPQALVQPDASLMTLIEPAHRATRDWARLPIGRTPRALHSFFAMITDCPSVQIVNQAQADHVAARLADGPYAGLPVLSSTAPFKAGGIGGPENYTHVPAGDLLLRHAADLYMHPNTIVALHLTGAALRNWLEHAVLGYRQILQGVADQALIGTDLPSFLYDTISGLTYEIDLAQPGIDRGGRRIHDLRWNGAPLDPDQRFILATNNYRGSGSGGYAPVDSAGTVLAERVANRDVLIAHLQHSFGSDGTPPPPRTAGWRFRPMPGTSVLFDTSPLARACLDDAAPLPLTPLGRTPDGFLRLRLDL